MPQKYLYRNAKEMGKRKGMPGLWAKPQIYLYRNVERSGIPQGCAPKSQSSI